MGGGLTPRLWNWLLNNPAHTSDEGRSFFTDQSEMS